MEAYAVVETGGKQYRVKAKDTLRVEHIDRDVGEAVELESVLALSDGSTLQIGKPELKDARVVTTVVEHVLADKVVSFKKNRRKGYKRKQGHRQQLTVLRVESIA